MRSNSPLNQIKHKMKTQYSRQYIKKKSSYSSVQFLLKLIQLISILGDNVPLHARSATKARLVAQSSCLLLQLDNNNDSLLGFVALFCELHGVTLHSVV